jgi:hypothetical protein
MDVRVLDLDGSITAQTALLQAGNAHVHPLQEWGPRIRMACGFGSFRRFEDELAPLLAGPGPTLTFVGSGDFHHVSLALVRRLTEPFNLLVLDTHPDWMHSIPFMHCGTWLHHALGLPLLGKVFHVGGDVDFDNRFRWLAPWPHLRGGRVTVFPAVRRYRAGGWKQIPHDPVRQEPAGRVTPERLRALLAPHRDELASRPLYVSIDKDVMICDEAPVNWDSGYLTFADVEVVLAAFLEAAGHRVAGVDVVGDWSAVRMKGLLRHVMHLTEHPALRVDPAEATHRNQAVNLALLTTFPVLTVPVGTETGEHDERPATPVPVRPTSAHTD